MMRSEAWQRNHRTAIDRKDPHRVHEQLSLVFRLKGEF